MWRAKNKGLLGAFAGCALVLLLPSITHATTNIQTNICSQFEAPSITSPVSPTETSAPSATVEGVGEPYMTVTIMRNGVAVGATINASDGSYGLEISLNQGDNTLVAREINSCNTVKDSLPVTVHRTVSTQPGSPSTSSSVPVSGITPPIAGALQLGGGSLSNNPIVAIPDTAGYPKPTIRRPAPGTIVKSSQIWVRGTAQPGSIVTIYVNGIGVVRAIASENGIYDARVSLRPGKNTIQVRAEQGSNVATSGRIEVTFVLQTDAVTPYTWDSLILNTMLIVMGGIVLAAIIVWRILRIRSKFK